MNDQEAVTLLQAQWANEFCPIVNGVIFDSGHMERLSIDRSENGMVVIEKLGPANLADFLQNNADAFSALTEFCAIEVPGRNVRISAGGGSGGGDGYVAVSDSKTNYLHWIAFFDDSNEFERLGLRELTIIAETNLRETWEISLEDPTDCMVYGQEA